MDSSVSTLIVEQEQTIGLIKRTVDNFKKIGQKNFTIAVARSRLANLNNTWTRCQKLNCELEAAAEDLDRTTLPYFLEMGFMSAEDAFWGASDYLTTIIDKLTVPIASSSAASDASHNSSMIENLHNNNISLPRISIPKFSGDYTDWTNFRDVFESLVATNDTLSNVQKLHHLKASLTGEAALLLKTVSITEANYASAWETLTSRYENQRAIISAHLSDVFNITNIKSENANELKRLRDSTNDAISALRNLKRPVDTWDDLIVFMTVLKLDHRSRMEWEMQLGDSPEFPKYDALNKFMSARIRALESMKRAVDCSQPISATPARSIQAKQTRAHASTEQTESCFLCNNQHHLYQCPAFRSLTIEKRSQVVRDNKRCFNCLRPGHRNTNCTSKYRCARCRGIHHTMLHRENYSTNALVAVVPATDAANENSSQNNDCASMPVPAATNSFDAQRVASSSSVTPNNRVVSNHIAENPRASDSPKSSSRGGYVFLATAKITVKSTEGRELCVRALIDPGSESTFVSEYAVQTLRAKRHRAHIEVSGVGGQTHGLVKSTVHLSIEPRDGKGPSFPVHALVFPKLTSYKPSVNAHSLQWAHLTGLSLADENPSDSSPIDLLIGADIYGQLLLDGLRQGPIGSPTAQRTIFGWILTGPMNEQNHLRSRISSLHCTSAVQLDELVRRFWEIEEIIPRHIPTDLELRCEQHFADTHQRSSDGRYMVRLPFKTEPPIEIGSSRAVALTLLQKSERMLLRRPELSKRYHEFLSEYHALGHMELVTHSLNSYEPVYLPHHPVCREDSNSTKVRVVFNASSRTSNQSSLNDHLLIGPKLQMELPSIIMRWRQHRLVYTTDIEKMFRQIPVHPADTDYQRILWRTSPLNPVSDYRLTTVTYGTASAPYLAIRVLKQLAHDERERFPLAASIVEEDTYVDDIFFGADDIDTVKLLRSQLTALLQSGGFTLKKWASNDPQLLIDLGSISEHSNILPLNEEGSVKILGINWHPGTDTFGFSTIIPPTGTPTKRRVLSHIAKLFDPLGWVAPVVIKAKILMQELWLRRISWDDELPDDLLRQWQQYCVELNVLTNISLPRWTGQGRLDQSYELHGFADASSRAYAAVVYLRLLHPPAAPQVTLLASKTKVAPIKTQSIPKLELNAAFLLSRLLEVVIEQLSAGDIPIHCWTDSTVALSWLNQHPARWKTFVANRVSAIQTKLPRATWHHVPTADNPADCASRGIPATDLVNHPLWWTGPPWLLLDKDQWPHLQVVSSDDAEIERRTQVNLAVEKVRDEWDLSVRISSWPRLLRVTAYVMRFADRCRKRLLVDHGNTPLFHLTSQEIENAKIFWIKTVQSSVFSSEIRDAAVNKQISSRSRLIRLNPFLDEMGILRVGGRLRNSPLQFGEKHPIILPSHKISDLIIRHTHLICLHGGLQVTLRVLRQQYWVIGGRNLVKSHIHRCIRCVRERANTASQIMSDLPKLRVTPARPFLHCGVDYAGPLHVLSVTGRGQKAHKAYIAVFVCLVTRAIHLELVMDYSSEKFLAAFTRFVSRRGIPVSVKSDNGTTFQGADRELTSSFRAIMRDPDLAIRLANDGTTWRFIPPSAPHHGGLWEAGVKSMKHHLRRVIGSRTLSIEEMTTLLTQVEACLNSRPLAPLSDDADDLTSLTPGHFLIGAPLVSVPEKSTLHLKESYLSRWQHVRHMLEGFWRVWSQDYLHSLQQRFKWRTPEDNIKVNDLVVVRNPILPPSKWDLGRIVSVHPGPDGRVRVVTVKTAKSVLKRPITQLCRLPVETSV